MHRVTDEEFAFLEWALTEISILGTASSGMNVSDYARARNGALVSGLACLEQTPYKCAKCGYYKSHRDECEDALPPTVRSPAAVPDKYEGSVFRLGIREADQTD